MSYMRATLTVIAAAACWPAAAQNDFADPRMPPVNDLPNPYSERQVMPLPSGRSWGSTAGVDAAKDRDDIWAIDRCGSNTCVGSSLNPLLHYDARGNLIGEMGAGLFAVPLCIHVDQVGNVWVTDPLPPDGRKAYRLTEAGEAFRAVIEHLSIWGQTYAQDRVGPTDLNPTALLWAMKTHAVGIELPAMPFVVEFELRGIPRGQTQRRRWWLLLRQP